MVFEFHYKALCKDYPQVIKLIPSTIDFSADKI